MSTKSSITLAIGIPSFRRVDGLELCLQSIAKQITTLDDAQIIVIVAKNDQDRQGALALVAQMAFAAITFACTFYSLKLRQTAVRRFLRARGKMRALLGASFEMYR